MARPYKRYLSDFICQDGAAITADTDSTGPSTVIDTALGGNADGCNSAFIEVDVTVAPTAIASCKIMYEAIQHDGAGYAEQEYLGEVEIPIGTGKYSVVVHDLNESGNVKLHAVDAGFTAAASCKPFYQADS